MNANRLLLLLSLALLPIFALAGCGAAAMHNGLLVKSEPPGARITLDGLAFDEKTPFVFNDLPTGRHSVEVALDGYKNTRRIIYYARGDSRKVSFHLEPEAAPAKEEPKTEPKATAFDWTDQPGAPAGTERRVRHHHCIHIRGAQRQKTRQRPADHHCKAR